MKALILIAASRHSTESLRIISFIYFSNDRTQGLLIFFNQILFFIRAEEKLLARFLWNLLYSDFWRCFIWIKKKNRNVEHADVKVDEKLKMFFADSFFDSAQSTNQKLN